MSHYGVDPASVCNAFLAALEPLKLQNGGAGAGGTGCMRTIKLYAGEKYEIERIERIIGGGGLPAFLVAYLGGPFDPAATNGRRHDQRMTFGVICAAASFESYKSRLTGTSANPGIWDLADWATYFCGRTLLKLAGIKTPKPTNHRLLRHEAEKYLLAVEFEAGRRFDLYDDELGEELTRFGFVANPLDKENLWTDPQHTEPNIADPATQQGGVVDL